MHIRIVFITGTDTGVGKTLLTALLLSHLRRHGVPALALKPFCSGVRADAELLCLLQAGDLTLDQINPFYFPEPVAPLVSARKHHRKISLEDVVEHIHLISSVVGTRTSSSTSPKGPGAGAGRSNTSRSKTTTSIDNGYLLIEGSGGLLVPLGEGYTVRDLIRCLNCELLVVSRNQLGTINHTLLTVQSLCSGALTSSAYKPSRSARRAVETRPSKKATQLSSEVETSCPRTAKLVLMECIRPDPSQRSNPAILAEMIQPMPLVRLPFLGLDCLSQSALKKNAKIFEKTLARLLL